MPAPLHSPFHFRIYFLTPTSLVNCLVGWLPGTNSTWKKLCMCAVRCEYSIHWWWMEKSFRFLIYLVRWCVLLSLARIDECNVYWRVVLVLFPRLNCYLITRNFDIPPKCLQHINFQSLNISNSALCLCPFLSHTFPLVFLTPLIFLSTCFQWKLSILLYYVCACLRKTRFSSLFSVNPFVYFHVYADCHRKGPHTIWFFFDLMALHRSENEKGKREVFNEMLNGCKAFAKQLSRTTDFIQHCIHQLIYWRYFSVAPFAYNSWDR